MQLGLRLIDNVCNMNLFDTPVPSLEMTKGNPYTLYFQVVQPNRGDLRYAAAPGATAVVNFKNLDSNATINRVATQPWPCGDPSIWSIPILPGDSIQPGSLMMTLTEGTTVNRMTLLDDLTFRDPTVNGKAFC